MTDRITALEEALQSGIDLIKGDATGSEWKKGCRDFVVAARSALAASRAAPDCQQPDLVTAAQVRVKPLVWFEGDEPDEWKSGEYDIWCEFGKYQLYYWSIVHGDPHTTAEAAKAAAQADYEARILAALDLTPAPAVEPVAPTAENTNEDQKLRLSDRFEKIYRDAVAQADRDEKNGLHLRMDGIQSAPTAQDAAQVPETDAERFDRADWFWRTADPDDNGYTPHEVVSSSMLGDFCVCEIASSYTGPTRYGFTAPVLDPESDDSEFLHFATRQEAIDAAKERATALRAIGGDA